MPEKPIPIICGPTGSGKTAAAVELAGEYPVEIVSADSRQIIRHLDIGTAKPTPEQKSMVKFHLIDLIEPGERYCAFRFIDEANEAIEDILSRKKIPLVVGGTGLYLRALTEGVVEIEQDDMSVCEELASEMESLGPEEMYRRLTEIDPLEAAKTHPHNKVRVIRALEIFQLTGKPKSELMASGAYRKGRYEFEYFCLTPPRPGLYEAINRRVDRMMTDGLLEELKVLIQKGYRERIRRANVIGYGELLDYLDGNFSLSEAVSIIKQNSRRYAKRQMTWFRRQPDCVFFEDRESLLNSIDLRGWPGEK
ncbi:MAG: tRNA (adenosine(37)-N6)-dimethylallyltransferase MiaA [Candidatus Zixiibacteriota bacterium]